MKRRDLVALLGSVTMSWPCAAVAQQTGGMRKIGVLFNSAPNEPTNAVRLTAFRQALQALGWTEGGNVKFEVRNGNGDDKHLSDVATELVTSAPDAILAASSVVVLALKRHTHEIPIVFVGVSDPVGQGLVASLARPGGNVTGFSNFDFAMATKWLQLLKEIAPAATRVALVFNPGVPSYRGFLGAAEAAAKSAGIAATELRLAQAADLGRVAALGRKPDIGLIVLPNIWANIHRDEVVRAVARKRLPAIYSQPGFTPLGGLMTYTIDPIADSRGAASYVDRILRGAKPGELPVQNPVKYDLSINLKTAKALGLTVPQSLLIQADEVIK